MSKRKINFKFKSKIMISVIEKSINQFNGFLNILFIIHDVGKVGKVCRRRTGSSLTRSDIHKKRCDHASLPPVHENYF